MQTYILFKARKDYSKKKTVHVLQHIK